MSSFDTWYKNLNIFHWLSIFKSQINWKKMCLLNPFIFSRYRLLDILVLEYHTVILFQDFLLFTTNKYLLIRTQKWSYTFSNCNFCGTFGGNPNQKAQKETYATLQPLTFELKNRNTEKVTMKIFQKQIWICNSIARTSQSFVIENRFTLKKVISLP